MAAVADETIASAARVEADAATRRSPSRRIRTARRGFVGALVFFAICEAVTRAELVNRAFLPPASMVLWRMVRLLGDNEFLTNVRATLEAWSLGLLVAAGVAIPLGVILGSSNAIFRISRTIIELVRPVPAVAVLPLGILLLGQGLKMKLALVAFAASWPILYNAIYGVHDVDPLAKDTARAFGHGRASIMARVVLPSAAPFIATGVRVSASIGLVVVVSAELLAGGDAGIGAWVMQMGSAPGNADRVYAGSVFAAALGYLVNLGLEAGERRLFAWRREGRGDDA